MKYKEKIIKLIRASIFLILLVCLIAYIGGMLERKASIKQTGAFFNDAENIDVIFLGTSHARDAVFPMELWNDYGITSHNFAGGHSTLALDYWILKNALDYAEPKVVVVDCTLLSNDEDKVLSYGLMHEQVDEFPLSVNKLKMLNDLLDNWNDRFPFIWKFFLYHSRWEELGESDFADEEAQIDELNRGSLPQVKVAVPDVYSQIDKNDKLQEETLGTQYLRRIIEECQARDIDILLTYLPFPASEEKQREANTVYDIAAEYNVNYINFLNLDVINYNTDCHDANSHLNVCGGRKVTDFLGFYIRNIYEVADHRGEHAYASWNDNYEEFMAYKINELKEVETLDSYLMMLADKSLSCCIYIDGETMALADDRFCELIANISAYENLEKLKEAVSAGKSYLLIVDNGCAEIRESVNNESVDITNTAFGHVEFGSDDVGGTPYLYIQDNEKNYLDGSYGVNIAVINKYSGSVEDVASFTVYDKQYYGVRAK